MLYRQQFPRVYELLWVLYSFVVLTSSPQVFLVTSCIVACVFKPLCCLCLVLNVCSCSMCLLFGYMDYMDYQSFVFGLTAFGSAASPAIHYRTSDQTWIQRWLWPISAKVTVPWRTIYKLSWILLTSQNRTRPCARTHASGIRNFMFELFFLFFINFNMIYTFWFCLWVDTQEFNLESLIWTLLMEWSYDQYYKIKHMKVLREIKIKYYSDNGLLQHVEMLHNHFLVIIAAAYTWGNMQKDLWAS